MSQEQDVQRIVRWLFKRAESSKHKHPLRQLFPELATKTRLKFFESERDLEDNLPERAGPSHDWKKCLILRGDLKDRKFIACCKLFWKKLDQPAHTVFRARIGFIRQTPEPPGTNLCFFGFRFETPESRMDNKTEHSSHDFFHVQYIERFDKDECHGMDGTRIPMDDTPAIPLPLSTVNSPASVLLGSVLMALYGRTMVNDLVNELHVSGFPLSKGAKEDLKAIANLPR